MLKKVIMIIVALFVFYIFNYTCKACSAYFPKSRCKKYIYIKNNILADILIAKSVSTDKFVSTFDYNKMSIIGIVSYVIIEPINIANFIIILQRGFMEGNSVYLETINYISMACLGLVDIIFLIVLFINTDKCKNR
ncbi:hypothetical protein [Clostridium butyricum]|uniref:hypothetical protein n=1 Tax=Clostridium butyricum TaxID=1492 RepID=UPI0032BFFAF1